MLYQALRQALDPVRKAWLTVRTQRLREVGGLARITR